MNILGLNINHIAELTTQVAQSGAIRTAEVVGDEVFDYIIGVAIAVQGSFAGVLAG